MNWHGRLIFCLVFGFTVLIGKNGCTQEKFSQEVLLKESKRIIKSRKQSSDWLYKSLAVNYVALNTLDLITTFYYGRLCGSILIWSILPSNPPGKLCSFYDRVLSRRYLSKINLRQKGTRFRILWKNGQKQLPLGFPTPTGDQIQSSWNSGDFSWTISAC